MTNHPNRNRKHINFDAYDVEQINKRLAAMGEHAATIAEVSALETWGDEGHTGAAKHIVARRSHNRPVMVQKVTDDEIGQATLAGIRAMSEEDQQRFALLAGNAQFVLRMTEGTKPDTDVGKAIIHIREALLRYSSPEHETR